MQDKLRAAFSKKEKAEMFLENLEKLHEEKNVGDSQYRVLKIEYAHMRDDTLSEINTVKNAIKKELDSRSDRLDVLKQELSYLETRFKVGQLSSDVYLSKEKVPKRQATELEKRIAELQSFLNATSSDELSVAPESSTKLFGINLGFPKKQSPVIATQDTQTVSSTDVIVAPESKEFVLPPVPIPVPMSVPEPVSEPEPPPPPPPPPPIIEISGLQIMPDRVREGGSIGIIATVTNLTIENIQQKVELKINGVVKESRDISLLPGEGQEITFLILAGKTGSYQVDINGITGVFDVVFVDTSRYVQ